MYVCVCVCKHPSSLHAIQDIQHIHLAYCSDLFRSKPCRKQKRGAPPRCTCPPTLRQPHSA